jgi:riboflavin kinase
MKISGVIQDGVGKGAWFTQLDWVVSQCQTLLGFSPFPGTLNVLVNREDAAKLVQLKQQGDGELIPDDPAFCSARVAKVTIGGLPAAIVFPAEDVRVHGDDLIEIIAGSGLKKELGLADGDAVEIETA